MLGTLIYRVVKEGKTFWIGKDSFEELTAKTADGEKKYPGYTFSERVDTKLASPAPKSGTVESKTSTVEHTKDGWQQIRIRHQGQLKWLTNSAALWKWHKYYHCILTYPDEKEYSNFSVLRYVCTLS